VTPHVSQETKEDVDMDLMTFRERLQKRCGVEVHEGVEVSAAGADVRNYLESPVPVANRTNETEHRIKDKMLKNKAGRYCKLLSQKLKVNPVFCEIPCLQMANREVLFQ